MNILVLGNGFDLAHELKTKYTDFLDFCKKKHPQDFNENEFAYMECCVTNLWMKHFLTMQETQQIGNTWIDFEKEIYNVIVSLKDAFFYIGNGSLTEDLHKVCQIKKYEKFSFYRLKDYLREVHLNEDFTKNVVINLQDNSLNIYIKNLSLFIKFLYKQLREFTAVFEKYLREEVLAKIDENSKYMLSLQSIGAEEGSDDVRVLCFNYTDTCERLYKKKFNTYCKVSIKPVYVHGSINESPECSLILGTQNFDNKEKVGKVSKPISAEFNLFKKLNQRHKFGTIEAYQELLKEAVNPDVKPVFHVIGHSLEETDHELLKHIFLANNNATIKIYYYDEESQERLMNKIVDIIGEKEVISKVILIDQHDEERGILKHKNKELCATQNA